MKIKLILKDLSLCLLSSVALILAFPQADFWGLAWFALIPLLFAIDGKRLLSAFGLASLTGVFFFAFTIYWFIHVTLLGAILLTLYFAVYFGIFALADRYFSKKSLVEKLFILPSVWVVLEFLRGHLLTGFNWVSLGLSQYKNLPLIQIADITGFYGVSFLVVMMNIFLKDWISARLNRISFLVVPGLRGLIVVLMIFVITFGYGFYVLENFWGRGKSYPYSGHESLSVMIVQGNVDQDMKWDSDYWPWIQRKQLSLTRDGLQKYTDLIIWPETSFPGFVWEAPLLFEEIKDFVREVKIPLVLGLVTKVGDNYFNSAQLVSKEGDVVKQYDKLHLVPFGEYVPLRTPLSFIPILREIGDFTRGKTFTLFPVGKTGGNLSVLICFEDTVPELSRGFVNAGANLLVNITNDAWFQDTVAPYLHVQSALFRAIENRRYLVRATNTGVSCFIDPWGRIKNVVQDEKKRKTYVAGSATADVALLHNKTFYTKYGDVFTFLCVGCILVGMLRKRN